MAKMRFSEQGYSLVEIMIAAGALVLIGLGASVLVSRISSQQTQIVTRDETSEFVGALSKWISTEQGCIAALVGKSFPLGGSSSLEISGYRGYGGGTAMNASDVLRTGYRISNQLHIKTMTIKDKGITPAVVQMDNVRYRRVIAQIEIEMESKGDIVEQSSGGTKNLAQSHRKRVLEVPVLLNEATSNIERCAGEATIADLCSALGSILDPVTNTCRPLQNCVMQGSFMTLTCNPSSYGCFNASGSPLQNPLTGRSDCPSGAVASQTGIFNYAHTASCGKKCTATIQNELRFFICLRCN